jgi:hypothetical protein
MAAYSEFHIRCRCGHEAPMDDFTTTAAGIELPRRHYQCRACGDAWAVRQVEPAWVSPSGFVMPPQLGCVPVQRTL